MTGGLGPTKDDITKQAIAQYFGTKLVFNEDVYERIKKFFEILKRPMSASHHQQCFFPENTFLLENKMGTAPGMLYHKDDKILISMPGVPYEMQYIMEKSVADILRKMNNTGEAIYFRTIHTAGESETRIEDILQPAINKLPEYIKIAFLPSLGQVRIRITGKHPDAESLKIDVDDLTRVFSDMLGNMVYGFDGQSLQESLQQICISKSLKLGTAESCTGGMIGHLLTTIPGSSAYFSGGIISYSNEMKIKLLEVSPMTLDTYGAVSEECVREMARGAIKALNTDVAVSVSGIAGPDGGSEDKPVGTIWMAIANREKCETYLLKSGKNRLKNIEYAAQMALFRVLDFIRRHHD
jgi:nicotinamide-nucleotide amidase